MNMEQQIEMCLAMILIAAGAFCAGWTFQNHKILFWKIKWIEKEHECARAQDREPLDINTIKEP